MKTADQKIEINRKRREQYASDPEHRAKLTAYRREYYRTHPEFAEAHKKKCKAIGNARYHAGLNKQDIERQKPETWANVAICRVRARAKKSGIPCTITVADLVLPKCCPVLGMEFTFGRGRADHWSSPSVDKIVPELGYVPGNVAVISKLANLIKSNTDAATLRKVADWTESEQARVRASQEDSNFDKEYNALASSSIIED